MLKVSRDSSRKRKLPSEWLPICSCNNPFKFIPTDAPCPPTARETVILCYSCKCTINDIWDDFFFCDMPTHQGDNFYLCFTCACSRKKFRSVIPPDLCISFSKENLLQDTSSNPVPALEYVHEVLLASPLKPKKNALTKSGLKKKTKISFCNLLTAIPKEEKQSSSLEWSSVNNDKLLGLHNLSNDPVETKARNSDVTSDLTSGAQSGNSLLLKDSAKIASLFNQTGLEQSLQVAFYKVCQVRQSLGRMPTASMTASNLNITQIDAERIHNKIESFIDNLKPLKTSQPYQKEQVAVASPVSPQKLLEITRRAYQKLQIDLRTGNRVVRALSLKSVADDIDVSLTPTQIFIHTMRQLQGFRKKNPRSDD